MKSVNGRIERLERQAGAGGDTRHIVAIKDEAESELYRGYGDEVFTDAELTAAAAAGARVVRIVIPDNGRDKEPAGS